MRLLRAPRIGSATGRGSCGGTSPLPPGRQWKPHNGRRQKTRAWRQAFRKIEALARQDPTTAAALATLELAVQHEADPALSRLGLGVTAMQLAFDCRVSWAVAMGETLCRLEAEQTRAAAESEDKDAAASA